MMVNIAPTTDDLLEQYVEILEAHDDKKGVFYIRDTQRSAEQGLSLIIAVGRCYDAHIPLSRDVLESSLFYLQQYGSEEVFFDQCREMLSNLEDSDAS